MQYAIKSRPYLVFLHFGAEKGKVTPTGRQKYYKMRCCR